MTKRGPNDTEPTGAPHARVDPSATTDPGREDLDDLLGGLNSDPGSIPRTRESNCREVAAFDASARPLPPRHPTPPPEPAVIPPKQTDPGLGPPISQRPSVPTIGGGVPRDPPSERPVVRKASNDPTVLLPRKRTRLTASAFVVALAIVVIGIVVVWQSRSTTSSAKPPPPPPASVAPTVTTAVATAVAVEPPPPPPQAVTPAPVESAAPANPAPTRRGHPPNDKASPASTATKDRDDVSRTM